jgi:RimJ/RimL family protein N-acetyltransferase
LNGADVVVRELEPDEWERVREIRLHALRTEPGVYFSSYAASLALNEADWRLRIRSADGQMFGIFDGERLVGITGVRSDPDEPGGETAMLVSSYLLPEYRGRGITRQMYEARFRWVRARPRYKRVLVSHRRSNEASRRAIERSGFTRVAALPTSWPDGTVDDEVLYELRLAPV